MLGLLLAGCATQELSYRPEPCSHDRDCTITQLFRMTDDPAEYEAPKPPKDLAADDRDQFIAGHRAGWFDRGGRNAWFYHSCGELMPSYAPMALDTRDASEAFMLGYEKGYQDALKDLARFEKSIQKRVDKIRQNKSLQRTR